MGIFEPKPGSVLVWSRIVHFLEGAIVPALTGHLWGYGGLSWGAIGLTIGGALWEISNKWLPGEHQFGDLTDWLAFVIGMLCSVIGYLIMNKCKK